ncbi:hypothetical protein Cni_G05693 [Canna indica]|uniref:Hyaluronan/mRNA-binding protein domain-containing protein n=1 Tax=Canna indica TaxID=4628 RepID=A0AAQ3Q596_9LILI|nr:hypothetical protein Cni_G05693 [Canna indica]
MSTVNPFDLLADDDNDDPSRLIALQEQKVAAKKPAAPATAPVAKLPSKPVPPAQAVREARNNAAPPSRGGASRGRGGRATQYREFGNGDVNGFSKGYGGVVSEEGSADKPSERERGGYGSQRQSFRGGRRGGYGNENGEAGNDSERPPRRMYDRRSGTGRGSEIKREGSGRGNWGTTEDDMIAQVTEDGKMNENLSAPKKQEEVSNGPNTEGTEENKEVPENETEGKELEDKEMTLEEYEKVKEEKRKSLLSMKSEERKVEMDKEFETMKQLSNKKENDDIFAKLGSDKDMGRKKDIADRDERNKKSVSITQFLKPAEGQRYYSPGGRGRGRGRGRGDREPFCGEFGARTVSYNPAPSIEDPGHFPALC